jgi:hypothetical protein
MSSNGSIDNTLKWRTNRDGNVLSVELGGTPKPITMQSSILTKPLSFLFYQQNNIFFKNL